MDNSKRTNNKDEQDALTCKVSDYNNGQEDVTAGTTTVSPADVEAGLVQVAPPSLLGTTGSAVTVTVHKSQESIPFGAELYEGVGNNGNHLYLGKIDPDGLLGNTCLVQGMRILSIDNMDCFGLSANDATMILQCLQGNVTIVAAPTYCGTGSASTSTGLSTCMTRPITAKEEQDPPANENDNDTPDKKSSSSQTRGEQIEMGIECEMVTPSSPHQESPTRLFDSNNPGSEIATTTVREDNDTPPNNFDSTLRPLEPEQESMNTSEQGSGDAPKDGDGILKGCLRDGHAKSTIIYIGGWIFLIAWWRNLNQYRGVDCDDLFSDCPIWVEMKGFVLFFWFIIHGLLMCECYTCSTGKYLRNMDTTRSVMEYLKQLYETAPKIYLTMKCYHMETFYTTTTDAKGNTTTTAYTAPVVTYRETEEVDIVSWDDVSVHLTRRDIHEYKLTKVKLTKIFSSDENYTVQRNNLIARNRHRDVFFDVLVNYVIEGFQTHVMSFVDLREKPPCVGWGYFVLAHLLFFPSLPYRIWISACTGKLQPVIHKAIQSTGSPPP